MKYALARLGSQKYQQDILARPAGALYTYLNTEAALYQYVRANDSKERVMYQTSGSKKGQTPVSRLYYTLRALQGYVLNYPAEMKVDPLGPREQDADKVERGHAWLLANKGKLVLDHEY